jgi:transposase
MGRRFRDQGVTGLHEQPRPGRTPVFSPQVALYVVKLACERPDQLGRSLSHWNCSDLAHQLKADGIVQSISSETIRGILQSHKLKPWRYHLWLSPKVPRDQQFAKQVKLLVELYTRPLAAWEMVLCVDEKTNLQPRPRKALTLPSRPASPIRLEHEYKRAGALHLFAAFDTRTGLVSARMARRKRQEEFIAFLDQLRWEIPASVTRIYLVLDNLSVHKGKRTQAWLAAHPRFICHFLPTHCSWMNQVEQWFSILQRKRLRICDLPDKMSKLGRISCPASIRFQAGFWCWTLYGSKWTLSLANHSISDFSDLDHLAERLMAFVLEWNQSAHPFNWSTKSATKVMAKCEVQTQEAAAA